MKRRTPLIAAIVAVAALAAIVVELNAGHSPAPLAHPMRSRPAAAFLDSVGVNVHARYPDTSYGNFAGWTARLRQLGIHHVRDGLVLDDPTFVAHYRTLAAEGVHASFIAGDRTHAPADYVRLVAGPLRGAVDELEGPNEPDIQFGPDWVAATRTFTEQLHQAYAATPSLHDVPLVGPSFVTDAARAKIPGAGRLWQVQNLHSYADGKPPETHLPAAIAAARARAPHEPVVVTEMGYHDAVGATGGQVGVSDAAMADYVPRDFLEAFAAGARRAYLYELADERPDPQNRDPEQHFGLLRADLSPKPAFTALQRMLAAIRASPGSGDRRQVQVQAGADVRSLLLDRPDGSRALVLWRRVPAGAPPAASVRVRFQGRPEDLAVRATEGSAPRSALDRDGLLQVPLGAGPVVVSFR